GRPAAAAGGSQDFARADRGREGVAVYRRLRSELWGASAEAGDPEAGAGSAGAEDPRRRSAPWRPRGGRRGQEGRQAYFCGEQARGRERSGGGEEVRPRSLPPPELLGDPSL